MSATFSLFRNSFLQENVLALFLARLHASSPLSNLSCPFLMADSSSAALCCASFPTFPAISQSKSSQKVSLFRSSCLSPSRAVQIQSRAKESDGNDFSSEDAFGFDHWKAWTFEEGVEWVPEDRVTLFTTDGLLQIGGSLKPRPISSSEKRRGKRQATEKSQRFQEGDYMNPNQGLCIGALFDIAATNGLDVGRRLCLFGFCRSIEMLSDVVEDTVLDHGGEVVATAKACNGGLQEKLTMTVVVPLLWGVPPASETLRFAVRSGGGIVEKVYWQWDFL